MAKKIKKIEVGSLVAFNDLDNAAWFEVTSIDGHTLSLIDPTVPNSVTQIMDKCFVKQVK